MAIDFTRPNLFRALLYFVLLYVLFRCRAWLVVPPEAEVDGAVALPGRWLMGVLGRVPVWREIFLFVTSFFCVYSLSRTLSRNLIYLERTFLPMLVFPLVALGYTASALTPVTLLTAALIVYAVGQMIQAYRQESNFGFFLHAAVALGAAGLLYPPAVVFFGLLPVGFVLFQQNWRSVITALLGYLFPLALYSYIRWGMGFPFRETAREIARVLTGHFAWGETGIGGYALGGLFVGLTLFAVIGYFVGSTKLRRRAVRGFTAFVWILLLAAAMFVLPCRSLDLLPIAAVPLAAILPAVFNRRSGWLPNLLYVVMLWSVLLYNLNLLAPLL